jgi:hypothetical protein
MAVSRTREAGASTWGLSAERVRRNLEAWAVPMNASRTHADAGVDGGRTRRTFADAKGLPDQTERAARHARRSA